ncbi:MAG: RNA-binding transcriptional accessory protein, partial [Paraglaciecola sp.]|nr:RNA-binding transcriptional accessory protein [Paraglaciecola sp.]
MIIEKIAQELQVKVEQVKSAVHLLDEGSTVPFIARYRKEATAGLDDTQLRLLEQRLSYLRDLEDRRAVIIKSISEQGKMNDVLLKSLQKVDNKTELEDIYLPYKPKRRTKGQIAIESGLEPLANALFEDRNLDPEIESQAYVNAELSVADTKAALEGAKYILMERFAEDAVLLQKIRQYLTKNAHIKSQIVSGKEQDGSKYSDYFSHSEVLNNAPSHRALAMFRGRNEGILQVNLDADPQKDETQKSSYCEQIIAEHLGLKFNGLPSDKWFSAVVQWTWRVKIMLHMENELFGTLREK